MFKNAASLESRIQNPNLLHCKIRNWKYCQQDVTTTTVTSRIGGLDILSARFLTMQYPHTFYRDRVGDFDNQ